jgi:cold shock CspA family protein
MPLQRGEVQVEGATVEYEIVFDRGKESAGNLKVRK